MHGNDRQGLERLALDDGRCQYTPKKGVCFTLTAQQFVRRLVSWCLRQGWT